MKDGNSFQFFLLIFACLPVNLFFVLHKKYKTLESQPQVSEIDGEAAEHALFHYQGVITEEPASLLLLTKKGLQFVKDLGVQSCFFVEPTNTLYIVQSGFAIVRGLLGGTGMLAQR